MAALPLNTRDSVPVRNGRPNPLAVTHVAVVVVVTCAVAALICGWAVRAFGLYCSTYVGQQMRAKQRIRRVWDRQRGGVRNLR